MLRCEVTYAVKQLWSVKTSVLEHSPNFPDLFAKIRPVIKGIDIFFSFEWLLEKMADLQSSLKVFGAVEGTYAEVC